VQRKGSWCLFLKDIREDICLPWASCSAGKQGKWFGFVKEPRAARESLGEVQRKGSWCLFLKDIREDICLPWASCSAGKQGKRFGFVKQPTAKRESLGEVQRKGSWVRPFEKLSKGI
jgi:hypothetical protein